MSDERIESMENYEDKLDPAAFEAEKWNKFKEKMESKEVFSVVVKEVVNGGVITYVDELRAFIPGSHVSLSRVDNLETLVGTELRVRVIEADQAKNRLILSASAVLKDEARASRRKAADSVEVGSVMHGKVESLQNYGAFVRLDKGLSGLVHVSQIAPKRIKSPADVLSVGEEVDVKVINVKDGKLSLSIRALTAPVEEAAPVQEKVVIPKAEKLATNLGDLLKGIQL